MYDISKSISKDIYKKWFVRVPLFSIYNISIYFYIYIKINLIQMHEISPHLRGDFLLENTGTEKFPDLEIKEPYEPCKKCIIMNSGKLLPYLISNKIK